MLYFDNFWHTCTSINLWQNDIKVVILLNSFLIKYCELQHIYTCDNQRTLRHVGLNIIIIVSNI